MVGHEQSLCQCSSPQCEGTARPSQLHLITHCGHTACDDCLTSRVDDDTCVHPLCTVAIQSVNLVKLTDLGSKVEETKDHSFGRKVEAIVDLVSSFPEDDQGLVFAPNDSIVEVLEDIFDHHGIIYHSLRGRRASEKAKIIESFKNEKDPGKQRKVLILDLGSESAAGM
jgi:hypothetical protein